MSLETFKAKFEENAHQARLTGMHEETNCIDTILTQMTEEISVLESDIVKQKKHFHEIKNIRLQAELENSRTRFKYLESDLLRTTTINRELEGKCSELNIQLEKTIAELNASSLKCEKLEDENKKLQRDYRKLKLLSKIPERPVGKICGERCNSLP